MSLVYKILPRAEWQAALAAGRFEGSAIDLQDGYIHLSTGAQAQETAGKHFKGQDGLVMVSLRADQLALTWEPSRGGALFPHLYGVLDPALALDVRPLPLDADGVPQLGELDA